MSAPDPADHPRPPRPQGRPALPARRTLHTGVDLLTDNQKDRLTALFASDEHVQVEATWGIYQRMIAAYRHPDRKNGRELMVKLIDSRSSGVPKALEELTRLGRTLRQRAEDVLAYFDRPGSYRAPNSIATISQVLAIPAKRTKKTLVSFLTGPEAEALIAAPDLSTWIGRRDRLLLHLGIQTGLRVSELVSLRIDSIQFGPHSQLECVGKGRKQRIIPLQKNTARLLSAWISELPTAAETPLFPTHAGASMTRAAVAKLLARHVQAAVERCPSLSGKNVTPHTLRHTCAMTLLHAGIDTASIALWLGHANIQTTQVYLHADLELKRRTLDRLPTIDGRPPARYQTSDALLAFLANR